MAKLENIIMRGLNADRPSAGTAGRLYYETDTSILYRDNGSAWESIEGVGDFSNPMTTAGDIITGGSSGTPTRLAIGSTGHVLTVSGGTPVWQASTGGFVNPMTTQDDIIIGGSSGTPARLAKGSDGQVLSLVGGHIAWDTITASGTGGSGDGNLALIATATLSAAGQITISGLAPGYKALFIVGRVRSASNTNDDLMLFVNGDNTWAHYRYSYAGGTSGTGSLPVIGPMPGASAGEWSTVSFYIPAYDQTLHKVVSTPWSRYTGGSIVTGVAGWTWTNTAPITSLTFAAYGDASSNLDAGSTISIYGLNSVTNTSVSSPQSSVMWHDNAKVITGNALTNTHDNSQDYNIFSYQNTPANGDTFEHYFELSAGTYTLDVLGLTANSRGLIDWYIDGVLAVSGQDWYSSGLTYNVRKTATVTVGSAGGHVLRGVINGKNGSSSDYQMLLTKISFRP